MQPKVLASEAADILGITVQAVYKQLKTKKLSYSKMKNRIYFEHETAREIFKDFKLPCKVVVFVLVKGGVGKSTICRETAIRSTLMGKRVLIIELDHQGNLTKSFNVNASKLPVLIDLLNDETLSMRRAITPVIQGLDLVPSRYDNSVLDSYIMLKRLALHKVLQKRITPLKKEYDLILIDCPPSLGQSISSATLCADLVVLPTTPCDFSDSGLDTTIREIKKMADDYEISIPMKIILNKYDNRETDSYETLSELIKHETYGKILFNCYIRKCKEIEKLRRRHSSVFDSTSETFGRDDIDKFTRELLEMNRTRVSNELLVNENI